MTPGASLSRWALILPGWRQEALAGVSAGMLELALHRSVMVRFCFQQE